MSRIRLAVALFPFLAATSQAATPENYAQPHGRKIGLNFIVRPAKGSAV